MQRTRLIPFARKACGRAARVTAAVVLLVSAFAAPVRAQQCPTPWTFDEDAVDKCFGNCGADCSNNLNLWCDNGAGWTVDAQYGPMEVLDQWPDSVSFCDDVYLCTNTCGVVQVPGQFTYWGTFSQGCYDHDYACRNGDWIGCYFPAPSHVATMCDGQQAYPFTYTGYMRALMPLDTQCVYAFPQCPQQNDEPAAPASALRRN